MTQEAAADPTSARGSQLMVKKCVPRMPHQSGWTGAICGDLAPNSADGSETTVIPRAQKIGSHNRCLNHMNLIRLSSYKYNYYGVNALQEELGTHILNNRLASALTLF